jgi:MoaA/NifB/PqqE/SkfB family radical SAM enzyme
VVDDDEGIEFMKNASGAAVTKPRELVINLTLRCPLKCSHCCFSSDMDKVGQLPLADVERAISQAARLNTIEIVHFVGGDPFLHPDVLAAAMAHAAAEGLLCGVTTSAYWAKSPKRALESLEPLRRAGLAQITISYDDAHAAFLAPRYVANALSAAQSLGLRTRVAVVVEPQSTITAAWIIARLGIDPQKVHVYETAINSTGRAAEGDTDTRNQRGAQEGVYRGPCHSMLCAITVDHDGGIRPCCGVLPHRDGLSIGNIRATDVDAAVRTAYDDLLFKWIAFEGPVAILADVTADDPRPLRPTEFDGICTACDRIFGDPDMLARVRHRAEEQRTRIVALETLYGAMGLFEPPTSVP